MILERLTKHNLTQNGRPVQLCLFIDGLDEYDGDHRDLIKTLRRMSASAYIKICASSRPWNPFQNEFGGDQHQMLTLQYLTHDDIAFYVRDNLQIDSQFAKLSKQDEDFGQLVNEVTDEAQGVFLWVYLVIDCLCGV